MVTSVNKLSMVTSENKVVITDLSQGPTVFNVHGSVQRINIQIYIQQDATLHSLFYLETAHVSGGTSTHNQEHKQLYLQHLVFVTPLLLPLTAHSNQLQLFHNSGR
jgi:hypothetical protein